MSHINDAAFDRILDRLGPPPGVPSVGHAPTPAFVRNMEAGPIARALRDLAAMLEGGTLGYVEGGMNIRQENHHGAERTTITILSDIVLRPKLN